MVIGARGSGEPYTDVQHGLGLPNFVAFQQIHKLVPTATVYGLPYQPLALNSLENDTTGYWNSVSTGTAMLLGVIQQEIVDCPNQRIALLGYSQGAQVVGDILPQLGANSALRTHIATVTLFGDPRFNPTSSVDRGSYSPRLQSPEYFLGVDSPRVVSSTWLPAMRSAGLQRWKQSAGQAMIIRNGRLWPGLRSAARSRQEAGTGRMSAFCCPGDHDQLLPPLVIKDARPSRD